ncbi:glycosyltransferase family 2 protein [Nocardia terpenica]|uniref:glycosyltransferase family 2 protein n=1 Tax=Nocardia terpenica TaxID=455432 RepID=UPI001895A8E9|nr:glycosyltransferase family 2 protein [Nocardia terpenica]MBF6063532.1 glycosyltransferase family 2 protein [Nocardia terpenica]MBF6106088.1 glycosyltransferase family 2 protein [Nocardia terpenica]MBF6113327.1 glycosyltransferase family 2 protein [Nocardia terpenica]MBF6119829.1 glycosyltransferase family 2 protein [Nocardia terpenica]MBF6152240.1 glycosyltransferase family 2 protein [Nocardia terpenica]
MSSIDVIILTYNSAQLLPEAVASVRAQSIADQVRITVIDNASGDDTLAVARELGIDPIANPVNIGFAAAINQAAATSHGDYVTILNPDAALGDPKCLEALLATLDDEQIGVVGTRMLTDGKPYPNGRRFPSTTTAARHAVMGILRPGNTATQEYFGEAFGRADADQPVDWVSGCCLMMRRPLWEEMGGFDERYWMYLEDCDLCWRLRQRGYRTVLSGPAWVIHRGGQSSRTRKTKSLWHHHRSALIFYATTRSGWKRALLPAAAAFLTARLGVLVAVNTARRVIARD